MQTISYKMHEHETNSIAKNRDGTRHQPMACMGGCFREGGGAKRGAGSGGLAVELLPHCCCSCRSRLSFVACDTKKK